MHIENKEVIWLPSSDVIAQSNLKKYMDWVNEAYGKDFDDYQMLWEWSVEDVSRFWKSIVDYFKVDINTESELVLSVSQMPDMKWFPGATLNYAAHFFRNKDDNEVAIKYASELQSLKVITWGELKKQVSQFRDFLIYNGVGEGDRVAAYLPNIPEAIVGFLASASIGAVWSSCSPDFGTESVIERMAQIHPKVFICANAYSYNGKIHDRRQQAIDICSYLPELETVVMIEYLSGQPMIDMDEDDGMLSWHSWSEALHSSDASELIFDSVPFGHPLYILYSSGTTGAPKAITHGHGGILLEHLKYLSFHNDVKQGETFFWYSTTGWMMWNYAISALLLDAKLLIYEGSASYPDLNAMWKLAGQAQVHHFGTSAAFVTACMKSQIDPASVVNLAALRSVGSTGSPLPPEGFDWIYQKVKSDVWLCSMSGGTDVCTAFVGGNPLLPLRRGEIQCRALGCALYAYDDNGNQIENEIGEMVILKPMPSMPIYFWGDTDRSKYTASYFEDFPGVWRHGDWVRITSEGSLVIYGRSDATLNRQGVRIGTSEIYRALDQLSELKDALIVNIEREDGRHYMPLFVVLAEGITFDADLRQRINHKLKSMYSPRHVPDEIILVSDIPYTISGKKMEAPVKKILTGRSPERCYNAGAMRNPEAMNFFKSFHLPD
jgi:acetoacetyl-CoA synthetase